MKKWIHLYTVALTLAMTFLLFVSFHTREEGTLGQAEPTEDVSAETPQTLSGSSTTLPQIITPIDLTKEYSFAGEAMPSANFDVLERLDRELSVNSYWHSNTLINLKASYRYFPIIEGILAKNGVPDDFKYLAVAESNLRNETSPVGAKGVWQFMKATAQHYGLEINSEVDERYNLEKATEAACAFLKDYYDEFGSWTLAAAAYNMGGPKLKNLIATQKAENYYDLNLNPETSRYIFRVIAIKEIMANPVAFGFYLGDNDLYKPLKYSTVTIDGPVPSWGNFAIEHHTTYRMLKVFNPWLISDGLSNRSGKTYEIRIPEQG